MNMQAMLKQAQALQKDMLKIKDEIEKSEFTGESGNIKVTVNGKKEVLKVEFTSDDGYDKDDLEVLADMIVVAVNNANEKVDKTTESKMGKFGNIPGLF